MNRILTVVITAVVLAAGTRIPAAASGAAADAPQKVSRHASLRFVSGRKIRADVVDSPATREQGLMFRRNLPKNYGMLFVFPGEDAKVFWMKNTWVSLDIVFIGADKRISRVHDRVRPSTAQTTDRDVARVGGLAQYVLELPAGAARRYGLKAGQTIDFTVAIPES